MDAPPSSNRNIGLCVLCGLPGAGKSTLARGLKNSGKLQHVVVIPYDDVIADAAFHRDPAAESGNEEASGRQTPLWKRYRQDLLQCLEHAISALLSSPFLPAQGGVIEGLWTRFTQCLESQDVLSAATSVSQHRRFLVNPKLRPICIILDDNFYYQSMRYEVYQLARKYSLGFCQLYLQCSVEDCLRRNKSRHHPVMDKTICLMDKKIEKPNPRKNPWEKNSLIIDSKDRVTEDDTRITDLLCQSLENPLTPPEDNSDEKDKDREICAANIIHQADQSLRSLISESMQTVKGSVTSANMKDIAQDLQRVKTKALDQLRKSMSGETMLPLRADNTFNVQSFFKEEKDLILQRYSHKDQEPSSQSLADRPTAPAIS